MIATEEFAVRSRAGAVRRFALLLLAMAMFVSACAGAASPSPSSAQPSIAASNAPVSAPPSAAASSAPPSASVTETPAPTSPSSGNDIDPCSLLTSAEVTIALEHPAPTPTSRSGYFPGVFNDGAFVTCQWFIPYPTVPENRSLTLTVCSCQVSVAQFEAWAETERAQRNEKATQVTGIGERAHLLGPIGIVFLYQKIAVEIVGYVPGFGTLPDATLVKNAKPYYTELAKKVISRLP